MGLLSGIQGATSSLTGHVAGKRKSLGDEAPPEAGGEDEMSILEPEQGNIILHMISQLR